MTTRNFVQGSRWTITLNFLQFQVGESDDINSVSLIQTDSSSVSWISPYPNPFELPDYSELPFQITWAERHAFLAFGACEVYIVRMLLDSPVLQGEAGASSSANSLVVSEDESEDESEGIETNSGRPKNGPPRVETTNKPAFLPASTTERHFTYIPSASYLSSPSGVASDAKEREYAFFAIAGNRELPAVIIRKDIDADLGGWTSCDDEAQVVGKNSEDEEYDMKGKYSCNALSFHVPIRSGLAWNHRVVVRCGAED